VSGKNFENSKNFEENSKKRKHALFAAALARGFAGAFFAADLRAGEAFAAGSVG
jgi:hypothetical protein